MAHDCATCTRRTLLRGIGVAVAGGIVSACGGNDNGMPDAKMIDAPPGSCPTGDLCLDITKAPNTTLQNVNGSVIVSSSAGNLAVVRTSQTAVAALSAICTHQGCTVAYSSTSMLLQCPCHGAQFMLNGSVNRGPATLPLKTYQASLAGNIITIVVG
jgi:cytochrome b6-f complex iron-sulfur subunit